jgi:hypothetical protein
MTGLVIYLIIGIIYVYFEHKTFDFNFEGMKGFEVFLNILQQTVHYLRVLVVWPFYQLEDTILFMLDRCEEEEDE